MKSVYFLGAFSLVMSFGVAGMTMFNAKQDAKMKKEISAEDKTAFTLAIMGMLFGGSLLLAGLIADWLAN